MEYVETLKTGIKYYFENFITVLGFGLLLVFVFLFTQLSHIFFSSGSIFIFYDLVEPSIISVATVFFASIIFLFFYSVMVCLMVFAIRNHLTKIKLHYYLTQKIKKFALKYFYFSIVLSVIAFLLVFAGNAFNIPTALIFLILFLIFSFLIFVPQAIVIDENSIVTSVLNNFEFISKNFSGFLMVNFIGVGLIVFLIVVEFVIDNFLFVGNIFSLILTFLFVIPFIEVLKTQLYMKKFALIN